MTKDEVIEAFDFERMHDYMVAVNWTWGGSISYIPSIYKMKEFARELLDSIDIDGKDQNERDESQFTTSGGIMVFCSFNREFGLRFDRPVNDRRLIRKGVKIPTIEAGWMYEE